MRAIVTESPGGSLLCADVAAPTPDEGELLIDVTYALLQPQTLAEAAGTVVGAAGCGRVAEDPAGEIAPGTLVAFVDAAGACAEHVVVARERVAAVPEGIEEAVAACMLAPGMTAHALLFSVRETHDGDTMVITDGASEVGLALTQLAAAEGATVFSVVRTGSGEEAAYDAGATGVFRYYPDAAQRIREANGGRGVDVVYESNAAPTTASIHPLQLAVEACAPRGLICAYGDFDGDVQGPRIDLTELERHGGLYLTHPSLRWYTQTADEFRFHSQAVTRAVEEGTLRFEVGQVVPLERAANAYAAFDSGEPGCLVVRVAG